MHPDLLEQLEVLLPGMTRFDIACEEFKTGSRYTAIATFNISLPIEGPDNQDQQPSDTIHAREAYGEMSTDYNKAVRSGIKAYKFFGIERSDDPYDPGILFDGEGVV